MILHTDHCLFLLHIPVCMDTVSHRLNVDQWTQMVYEDTPTFPSFVPRPSYWYYLRQEERMKIIQSRKCCTHVYVSLTIHVIICPVSYTTRCIHCK